MKRGREEWARTKLGFSIESSRAAEVLSLRIAQRWFTLLALLTISLASVLSGELSAQTFKAINYPGAHETTAQGINAFGQIVGGYQDGTGAHAFIYNAGKFTSFDFPGATSTAAYGINNAGQIVGTFSNSSSAGQWFLYSGGVFTALSTGAYSINNSGAIVTGSGFVNNGAVTVLNDPNAATNGTDSWGINDLDQVVGFYEDPNFTTTHGFLFSQGGFSTIFFPGQNVTSCFGINNHQQIVGSYIDTRSAMHGFLFNGGNYTGFDYPGTVSGTIGYAINDFGQIVGVYTPAYPYYNNGFLYSPAARNPLPFISQPLAPETVLPGSAGLTLTVSGTGFVQGSVVYWNGSARQTSFQNSEKLTATINSSDLATEGTVSVTVVNPAPGGGTSNVQFFQITNPVTSIWVSQITLLAGSSPQRNVAADFNHDGNIDLAAADGANNQVVVMLGNGNGTFQSPVTYQTGNNPSYVIAADFNGDGNIDLAVANYNDNTISILLGNGDGTFRPQTAFATGTSPWSLAAGDFNGDGRLDLASVNNNGNSVSILLGNGDGTFQPRGDVAADNDPRSIAIGDFNGDGILDMAVANFGGFAGNTVSLFLGNGNGTFQPKVDYAASGAPLSIVAADFNGDGKLDLAVDNSCGSSSTCGRPGSVSILLGNGDGTFQNHVDYSAGWFPYTIVAGDFNGDGKIDLAVANLDSQMVTVLSGAGDGTFPTSTQLPANGSPVGLLAADFNGDGKLDFAVGTGTGILIMFQEVPVPTVTVPSVVGMTLATAKTSITAAHLAVGSTSVQMSTTVPAGKIISQNPAANTVVAEETAVNLLESCGAAIVPYVLRLPAATGENEILAAGLGIGTVTYQRSLIPAGEVISTSPAAGTMLCSGAKVSGVISSGPIL